MITILIITAIKTSKLSFERTVNICGTTKHYIPEGGDLSGLLMMDTWNV
jgi:hypothetical protein